MEAVLDANVLFRTLISQGDIIKLLFDRRLVLFAPLKLKDEFLNNRADILAKSRLSESEFNELASLLFKKIIFVPLEEYGVFIPKAKELLGRHEKDEDFIALCLSKNLKVWTYESLLFEIGFGVSTKEISDNLCEE